ncbi:MAG TPA: caspase family protein [Stellaceae bacterium]|jgi:hypothetical protein|nr:caspase family protein [Stellaceae bacterium]
MIQKHIALVSVLGLAMVSGTSVAMAAGAAPGAHLALVIGNSTYAHLPPLPSCADSAKLVAASLTRAGFTVTQQLDRSNGQMSGDLAALADTASHSPGASVIVYVCGYAMSQNNRAFLLPVSATVERDTDVLAEGLAAKSAVDLLQRSGAVGLVLLDAVAKPNGTEKLAFASAANPVPGQKTGLAAATMSAVPPSGASSFATALGSVLVGPDVEAVGALKSLQQRLEGKPGIELAVMQPAGEEWLVGGPKVAPAAPPQAMPAAQATTGFADEAHMTDADRRKIQRALQHLGYYDGRVDGIFGADTRAAIRRFQHEISTEMTGTITPSEAGRLLAQNH